MALEVNCPRCGKPHPWQGNPFRPFCSERCKLIDLGAWVSEQRAIPGEEIASSWPEDEESSGQPPRH